MEAHSCSTQISTKLSTQTEKSPESNQEIKRPNATWSFATLLTLLNATSQTKFNKSEKSLDASVSQITQLPERKTSLQYKLSSRKDKSTEIMVKFRG
jgi:hypothetical protein